jgi:hypothetical protein
MISTQSTNRSHLRCRDLRHSLTSNAHTLNKTVMSAASQLNTCFSNDNWSNLLTNGNPKIRVPRTCEIAPHVYTNDWPTATLKIHNGSCNRAMHLHAIVIKTISLWRLRNAPVGLNSMRRGPQRGGYSAASTRGTWLGVVTAFGRLADQAT